MPELMAVVKQTGDHKGSLDRVLKAQNNKAGR